MESLDDDDENLLGFTSNEGDSVPPHVIGVRIIKQWINTQPLVSFSSFTSSFCFSNDIVFRFASNN